jgi:hypothetical protein
VPHTTHAYPFEGEVLEFASKLSLLLTGADRTFILVLDAEGRARSVTFERTGDSWHDLTRERESAGGSYLFYDPFDVPEYCWLSWHRIARTTMERLVGRPFGEADFLRLPYGSARARELRPAGTFPDSWGVMF